MQLYISNVFMTGIMSEWAMSMIEDNLVTPRDSRSVLVTEVYNLQGICPLKDEWVFGCSLKTRLADQTKTQQLKWLWSKDSMNSTINQRLVE